MFEFIGFIFWLLYWVFYIGMWLLGVFVVFGLIGMLFAPPQTEEERKYQKKNADNFGNFLSHGALNQMLKCSHCDEKGGVRTKSVSEKKGISGGKAVGGLLTGGVSLVATGISRREKLTKAFCEKCNSTWRY